VVRKTGSGLTRADAQSEPGWEIFARAQNGEEVAWRALMSHYRPRLLAIATLVTGNGTVAEDVVQETFSRSLAVRVRNYNGTVRGLLGTIAYRLAVKATQRSRREIGPLDDQVADPNPSALDTLIDNERDRAVTHAIHALPADQREAMVLRFYAGHSYEEIAAVLDIPVGTAKSRVFYAVKACRELLKSKGVLE